MVKNIVCKPLYVRDLIGGLTNLKALDISNNALRSLPDAICDLGRLERLDCSYNELQRLPQGLSRMTSLRDLRLSKNKLRDFSATCVRELQGSSRFLGGLVG